jgi:hypothetical protein
MPPSTAQLTWKVGYPTLALEAVDRILAAPALKELPLAAYLEVRGAAANVKDFLSLRARSDDADSAVAGVDFPPFVADLIKGTFEAITDASIQQLEDYAELLKNVAASVNEFAQELDEACLRRLQDAAADLLLAGVYALVRPA